MKKAGRKPDPGSKVIRKTVRFALREWSRVKWNADTYAGGNVAKWLRHAALQAERKFLK